MAAPATEKKSAAPAATSPGPTTPVSTIGTASNPAHVRVEGMPKAQHATPIEWVVGGAVLAAFIGQIVSHRFTRSRDRRRERVDSFDRVVLACTLGRQALDEITASTRRSSDQEFGAAIRSAGVRLLEIDAAMASFRARFGPDDQAMLVFDPAYIAIRGAIEAAREARSVTPDGSGFRLNASKLGTAYQQEVDAATRQASLVLMSWKDRRRAKRAARRDRKTLEAMAAELPRHGSVRS